MSITIKRFIMPVLLAVLLSQLLLVAGPDKTPPLEPRYSQWIELVDTIITPTERQVFRQLNDNRARDAFINLFWRMRDPSRGTPQNEFKDEHDRRVAYADRYFRGSPIRGSKGDRGRIYIILGPPLSQNEVMEPGLAPTLIWDYQENAGRGLPTAFRVVFYKRRDNDDYKLYIPAVDGPAVLLRSSIGSIDANDYAQVYQKIKEIQPAVAEVALSLIPGENVFNFNPSMEDQLLIRKIEELPARALNVSYARQFSNYQGLVDVNVTTNYIDSAAGLLIAWEPRLGLRLLHIALRPERLSVDFLREQNKYYFAFKVRFILKKGETTVFQYKRDYSYYLTRKELDGAFASGVVITDAFPVLAGEYLLTAVIQNAVNDEISYVERHLLIPNQSGPALSGPIISYQAEGQPTTNFIPFAVAGRPLKIEPKRQFGLHDTLFTYFWVDGIAAAAGLRAELDIRSLDVQRPFDRLYPLPVVANDGWVSLAQQLDGIGAGNYNAEARLLAADGQVLDRQSYDFSVSLQSDVPHPPIISKNVAYANRFLYFSMLANMLENSGDLIGAESFYERALAINPAQHELIKSFVALLLKVKNFGKALEVLEPLAGQAGERFNYLALKGRVLFQLDRWQEAIAVLQEAVQLNDSDPVVLHIIGISYLKTGDRHEALRALRALLKISPQRQDVADLVKRLEKEWPESHIGKDNNS